jgi:eukaryotic-like serine/threonine-protein kinase
MQSLSDATDGESDPLDPGATITAPGWSGPLTDLTPHARGALGEVFRATDSELHRTVAVKCLQQRYESDSGSRQRFLLEAEVTARLEHPGVVPVYALFAGANRLAYSMRFVEGKTFAEEIAAYHAGSPDPVLFRRLLQAFLQVCQTVAYAHSRGVIHRDLKPANVMVGKFGETLVVDWGLAKVVGRPMEARASGVGETLIPSSSDSGPGDTVMGSAVGTPAYMSPEQAAGRWDVVAQASDVYGLGAVLCAVLTGKPPFEHGNWPEMQQKIQQGDFLRPRQLNPDVPRQSEAVCLKAMALRPQDRYVSAAALAEDVEHWLAGEPVTAYREPFPARARRWARRHRTLVSAAAVLLVAAVVGLSIGTLLLQRARIETEDQRKFAVTAQRKAEAINRFLVDDLLKQADPVNNVVGEKLTVQQLLDKAADKLDDNARFGDQPEVEAEVRAVIGHAYEYLSLFEKAERHDRRAWELLTRLHGPDDRRTLTARNRYVFTVVTQEPRPEAEPLARAALADCTRVLGEQQPETGDAASNLAEAYAQLNRLPEAVELRTRASRILNATLGPTDFRTLEIDNNLGVVLVRAGRPAEGVTLLQSVVARRQKASPLHAELGSNLGNLGGALVAAGQFSEAETTLREAIRICEARFGRDHLGTFSARNLLCSVLEHQSRWGEAEQGYLAVLADRRKTPSQQPFIGRTLGGLARLYAKQERWADAAPYIVELMTPGKLDPARSVVNLAPPLAAALAGTADLSATEPLLRECRDSLKARMWAGDWLTAEVASRYGDCLRRQGKMAEAEPILTTASNDILKAVGAPAWSVAAAEKRVADLQEPKKELRESAK